jgi:hypothetical protein
MGTVSRLMVFPIAIGGIACAQSDTRPVDPFTKEQRIQYFLQRTFSWQKMARLGADSVADQLFGGSTRWGGGSSGLASRYFDSLGTRVASNSIELGLGLALHEDGRYKHSGETGFRRRFLYATTHALLASVPDGGFRPAYSRIAASFGAEFISTTWRPQRISPGESLRSGAFNLLDRFPNSYLDEFSPDLMKLGRRVWRKFGFLNRSGPAPEAGQP